MTLAALALGATTYLNYHDIGQHWKYQDSNYMYNQFGVDHKNYAKFEADMARKMAQQKPAPRM